MTSVDVIIEDLKTHPCCTHGPTLLFSRESQKGSQIHKRFYACSAYRDRKLCSFFMYEDEKEKNESTINAWVERSKKFTRQIRHKEKQLLLKQIKKQAADQRNYCQTCSAFELGENLDKHKTHEMVTNITNQQLHHPTEILTPVVRSKGEAQFLFEQSTIECIVRMFETQGYSNIMCIGTPKIHEFIVNQRPEMKSLLLDINEGYHNFYGPSKFCWYNMFNHHFFFEKGRQVFENFLQPQGGKQTALIMDPPFGGRTEPLSQTIKTINNIYKNFNETASDLPIFWVFPYFMEPQILNYLPNFTMMDYMVNYENHENFREKQKSKHQGSPVRIFTNVDQSLLVLSQGDYKFCGICKRWVYKLNKHCKLCNACTSKDGRTYKHCTTCGRCVKPTWQHCQQCNRCALVNHHCGEIQFLKECFNCKKYGHKKSDCPQQQNSNTKLPSTKRKKQLQNKLGKKRHKT